MIQGELTFSGMIGAVERMWPKLAWHHMGWWIAQYVELTDDPSGDQVSRSHTQD